MKEIKQQLKIILKTRWFLVFLSIFLLSINIANSATLPSADSLNIRYFSLEDGLSQVSVHDLVQDRFGFIWIATQDGLNRFDGTRFEQFKYRKNDSTSISGNYINALLEDNQGNIWVGTQGDGLCWYEYDYDIFHRYELQNTTIKNESISDMTLGSNGDIWVASRLSGLHQLKPASKTYHHSHSFAHKSLDAVFMSDSGCLWLGDVDGNIFKWESAGTNQTGKPQKAFNVSGGVRAFYETSHHLFIGTNDGLFFYDKDTKEVVRFEFEPKQGEPTRYVTSFLKVGEHKVWVGTGNGLYLFDWKQMVVVRKIGESETTNGLSSTSVEALLGLSDNQIFVGTGLNLHLLDFAIPVFKNISKDRKGSHLLNYNVIFSIYKENNNLWVGTAEGGLNLIQNDQVFYFNKGFLFGNVRGLAKDSVNQRLWIATTRGLGMINLATFDPHKPEFNIFQYNPNDDNSISTNEVLDIAIDKNQNIWGGTYGQGIFRFNLDQDGGVHIDRFKHNSKSTNSLVNDYVHCISIDADDNVWVGTEEGVSKLTMNDNGSNQFTNFSKTSDPNNSLSANSVYDILVDGQGTAWVGTQLGLNKVLMNGEIKSWMEQEQFPNAVVYSVQDDDTGKLWLGTNNGIVRFDPVSEKFTHYGVEDGIQSREFDVHTKFRDKEGNIYLGGIGGITYFHPKDLAGLDRPQPLYFSQLRVKDLEVNPSGNQLLKKALRKTNYLEIREGQFPFYLQFSSIDFRLYKDVEYAYKLLPDDKTWNILASPEIQFLNLPSGHYTLLVNGFSRGKEWTQAPLKMELSILPPWWQSWWAYVLYFCLLALLTFWFYRFQLSRKLAVAEGERLREVNQLKNSLYTNITHEFRTPLTVILGMAEAIQENIKERYMDNAEESLSMIQRNGRTLLHLVNQMLNLAKLESGKMELQWVQADIIPFVKYLGESFQSLAHASHIDLTVYAEVDELIMDFDSDKLSIVISNLLSNAIKFTLPGGKIIVHLNRITEGTHEYFLLKVKDNGMGIPKEALSKIFDRFYQTDGSSSHKGEGTGIGLALTKELVTLMHGTIGVQSTLDKGSEFRVQIPVSRNATMVSHKHLSDTLQIPTPPAKPAFHKWPADIDAGLPLALIIEDNTDVAHYLKTSMHGKYVTLYANNGTDGLEMAFEKIPDVIICDVMMPGKDGFEVCSTLKADIRTDHIPIIMLTAKATMKDRLTGLSHGADAYLEKPFVKAELFTRLDQLVLLRKKMIHKFENDDFTQFLKNRPENPEAKFLRNVLKVIHKEMNNENFGTRQLAYTLHLSESQLYRKIKAITGKSTAIFIRSTRLQKAKELILTSDKNISEVAYEVGFNDPSWFSRAFKEEFGFTPSEMHK